MQPSGKAACLSTALRMTDGGLHIARLVLAAVLADSGGCLRLGPSQPAKLTSRAGCAGYGGGMSSAKAALESDTRVLAYEAGRKHGIRVNAISAGPLGSRAAKAIGFIDDMIKWVPGVGSLEAGCGRLIRESATRRA